jgi:hypothetical protein
MAAIATQIHAFLFEATRIVAPPYILPQLRWGCGIGWSREHGSRRWHVPQRHYGARGFMAIRSWIVASQERILYPHFSLNLIG